MKEDGYRLNVGVIIANKEGKLLICKRKGMNSWQFPQGGIDYGETPLKAAKRELFEEVGIKSKSTKLISNVKEWLKYDVPKKSRRRRFLDKKFDENWRDKYHGTSQENHFNAARIDRSKALDILGLTDPVTREEIKEAHRRLMLANHPDRGGSTFLATQINEAKDFLLKDNE